MWGKQLINFIIMKDKIIAALKVKYANLGLSDKAFAGIAEMLAITTLDEATIETAISTPGVDAAMKGIQAEGDIRAAKAKKPEEKPEDKPKPNDPPTPPVNETSTEKLIRELAESVKTLTGEVQTMKAGAAVQSRQEILTAKLKDVPEAFRETVLDNFKYMSFKDDATFTEYVTSLDSRIEGVKQTANDTELKNQGAPILGVPNAEGVSTKVQEYVASKAEAAKSGSTTDLGGKKV